MTDRKHTHEAPLGGATDQVGIGPTGIAGAEASELPDHGRGSVETDPGREFRRKLPEQTGGIIGDGLDVGLEGEPDLADIRRYGGRKRN